MPQQCALVFDRPEPDFTFRVRGVSAGEAALEIPRHRKPNASKHKGRGPGDD